MSETKFVKIDFAACAWRISHRNPTMIRPLRGLAAGLFLLAPIEAYAASAIWNPVPVPVFNASGNKAAGARAFFYQAGTTTGFTVFSDNAQTTPHAQPVVADANGVFPAVYVPYTASGYRVRVTTSTGVVISDVDGIANPSPPSAGGGGGITVSTEQVFQPGWTVFLLQTGTVAGFVRLNGRTIGSATSGASERANADTASVYTYFWTNCADAQCPVSSGRGASASADFAANKTLMLPDMRGRLPAGLDDMGNSAANRVQRSPTITTTSGVPTAAVSSAAGLVIGMKIVSANVPSGTTITAISGTTITMSANASVSAGPSAARFSMVSDGQTPVGTGGEDSHMLATAEMPAHNHGVSDAGHTHTEQAPGSVSGINYAGGGANANFLTAGGTISTGSATTGITVNSTGGSLPHNLLPPVILGGWYAKL
jgi:microcystin-dependent protein